MTLHEQITRFGRYGIIGVASNVFCFLIFLGLVHLGTWPVLASGIVYLLGVTISYFANRTWSFRSERTHAQDLPRFLLSYGVGLVFSVSCIWVLLRWLSPALAQLVTIFATAVVIYTGLSVAKFGQGTETHAD